MSVIGNHSGWVVGCSILFKRDDDSDGTKHPVIDFGLIRTLSPTSAATEIKQFDPRNGHNVQVDQAITQVEEAYDVTCENLNNENLAIAFLGRRPEAFEQTVEALVVTQYGHADELLKLIDTEGINVYNIKAIAGIATGTQVTRTVSAVNTGTGVFTFSADHTLIAGDKFIFIPDLTDEDNFPMIQTLTVATAPTSATLTVEEEVDMENGDGGTAYTGGTILVPNDATGWHNVDLIRGTVSLPGLAADGDVNIYYVTEAYSGKRKIRSLSLKDSVKGTAQVFFARDFDRDMHARICRVAITPNGMNLTNDQFSSFSLKFSVLTDITDDDAGLLMHIRGDVPAVE